MIPLALLQLHWRLQHQVQPSLAAQALREMPPVVDACTPSIGMLLAESKK